MNRSGKKKGKVSQRNKTVQKTIPSPRTQDKASQAIKPVVILCLPVLIALDLIFYRSTLEDAYIGLRYAKHLAAGYGIGAWNPGGTRVEGFTSLLWVLVLGAGNRMGISLLTLSKVWGILSHLGCFLVLVFLGKFVSENFPDTCWEEVGGLASIAVAVALPFAWYAVSGMETVAFSFLILLAVVLICRNIRRYSVGDILALCLLVLLRPEGLLIALASLVYAVIACRRKRWSLRPALVKLGIIMTVIIAVTLWRLVLFGYPLPNTYYAKATGGLGHLSLGLDYLTGYLVTADTFVLFIFLAIFQLILHHRKPRAYEYFLWVFLGVYFLYIIKVGGDNPWAFPYWRHIIHIYPLLAVTFSLAITRLFPASKAFRMVTVLTCVLLFNKRILMLNEGNSIPGPMARRWHSVFNGQVPVTSLLQHQPPSPYFTWLKKTFRSSTLMATSRAGALPFYTDLKFIDILGLNDTHIAHHGVYQQGAVDTKTDMAYVMNQRPDLIDSSINPNHILAGIPVIKGRSYWRTSEDEMRNNLTFQREYLFVKNAPYTNSPRALFIRRDFYESLPNKQHLKVIPVKKTSLYSAGSR
jgi:arabinofuranosyltransferase